MPNGRVRRWIRLCLAGAVVFLAPSVTFLWLDLYVSGYTFEDDGRRNLGHLAKAVSLVPFVVPVFGIPALASVLGCIAIARATGCLSAIRLIPIAVAAGGLLGSSLVIADVLRGADIFVLSTIAIPTAGAVSAGVLASVFVGVSGIPLRARSGPWVDASLRADLRVIAISSALVLASVAWLASLWIYSLAHPCDCG